jgi:ELWxxDGT repeat protein
MLLSQSLDLVRQYFTQFAAIDDFESQLTSIYERTDGESKLSVIGDRWLSGIVFIDSRIPDCSYLIENITPGLRGIILDVAQDGILQITQILAELSPSVIYVVAHGSPGHLTLGATALNLSNINQYQSVLSQWFKKDSQQLPQLFIYGCHVAMGDAGSEFLEKLHIATGASIAASPLEIGNLADKSNWQLPYQLGNIKHQIPFKEIGVERYQGTFGLPRLVKDIDPNLTSTIGDIVAVGDRVFFTESDNSSSTNIEPWVSDGTEAGTFRVKDIYPGVSAFRNSSYLTAMNGKVYFSANPGNNDYELWVSDGTEVGTKQLKDINPGLNPSDPMRQRAVSGNKLFFTANDGTHGYELWISDGTEAGTKLVKDILPGIETSDINPFFNFTPVGDRIFFGYSDPVNGGNASQSGLWVSDGTDAGTYRVSSSTPYNSSGIGVFGNKILYASDKDSNAGLELWISDGTSAGTNLLKDINLLKGIYGNYSSEPYLRGGIAFNGKFYFSADDGIHGQELWVTDGTTTGTQLFADINPGIGASNPGAFTIFNNNLYFMSNNGVNGNELWVTNGTAVGTTLIKDINPGSSSGIFGDGIVAFDNHLYFTANDGVSGNELWISDGTAAGTNLVSDIRAGSASSYQFTKTVTGNKLFFEANDGINGGELWVVEADSTRTITRNDFNGDGKSDILWRNDDGRVALWQMNGSTLTTGSVFDSVPTSWKISSGGDFNADGKSDILWRNTDGSVAIWTMNGSTSLAKTVIGLVPSSWQISGTGDFGGDGKSDILWRNTNGDVAIWQMNGTTPTSQTVFANVSTDWQIAGIGDFGGRRSDTPSGDGKSDILWRNANGDVALWLMNGTTPISQTVFANVSTDWKIAGTADFNGDGEADILWRNATSGQVAIWTMNGDTALSKDLTAPYPSVDNSWKISGTSDFNGDGNADILWRNDNGSTSIWEMNGANVLAANPTNIIVDNSWKIAAPIL